MAITDYTSYREVRTACGLTLHDISDDMLGDNLFSDSLYVSLNAVTLPDSDPGPGSLSSRFAEIVAKDEASRTDKEKLLLSLTRLFSTYTVASEVCTSLSLTAAKLRSDGKTVDSRFSTDLAFSSVKRAVAEKASFYRAAIENINDTVVKSYDLITVVKPEVDVVTNE